MSKYHLIPWEKTMYDEDIRYIINKKLGNKISNKAYKYSLFIILYLYFILFLVYLFFII